MLDSSVVIIFVLDSHLQVFVLVDDYLKYQVVQSTEIVHINSMNPKASPRITLCNLKPFQANLRTREPAWYNEYLAALQKNTDCGNNCSAEDQATLLEIFKELNGVLGMNQFAGVEIVQNVGFQKESFIVSCRVGHKKEVVDLYSPCDDKVKITSAFNPVMSNCFSVDTQLNSENQHDSPTSLSLILFLDNLLHDESFAFDELIDTGTVGAYVGLGSRTHHSNVHDTWITAAPGSHELILNFPKLTA